MAEHTTEEITHHRNILTWANQIADRTVEQFKATGDPALADVTGDEWDALRGGAAASAAVALDALVDLGVLDLEGIRKISASVTAHDPASGPEPATGAPGTADVATDSEVTPDV